MFTEQSQRALLEFLRNLTPQILFLTLAIVFFTDLDVTHFEWTLDGLHNAAPSALCLVVFFVAMVASMNAFLQQFIVSSPEMDEAAVQIRQRGLGAWRTTWLLLKAAFKHNKTALFEAVLALTVCLGAFVAVGGQTVQGVKSSALNGAKQAASSSLQCNPSSNRQAIDPSHRAVR